MSESREIAVQGTLSPDVFSQFINLQVGFSLGGSANYALDDLEKVLAGEPLHKGAELVITARYYVADVHMPVTRDAGYDYGPQSRQDPSYRLGDAKVDTKLIKIEKIDVQRANLQQSIAARCTCLVANLPNVTKPLGYKVANYPLTSFWASNDCPECGGRGYVYPRKNKAPLSDPILPKGVIVLVDQLPETPDIPEGGCPQCGVVGGHKYQCPVKIEEEKRKEAEAKAALSEAKKQVKKETGQKAPVCFGRTWDCYPSQGKCAACPALTWCAQICGKKLPAPAEAGPGGIEMEPRPECFGVEDAPDPDACEECVYADECAEQATENAGDEESEA